MYPFVKPPLPYPYDSLEPYIDTKTMTLHYTNHFQTYVDNLNKILSSYPEYQNLTLEQLLYNINTLPLEIQAPVKNNAGGIYNHTFFFESMTPESTKKPVGVLSYKINSDFTSFENFQKEFKDAALTVFGSGYVWLVLNDKGDLEIITTLNQDTPLPMGYLPLLNLDLWEHAYYLKNYYNRSTYIDNWFNLINWEMANNRLFMGSRTS